MFLVWSDREKKTRAEKYRDTDLLIGQTILQSTLYRNSGIPLVQFQLRRLGTPRANWVTDSFALAINLVIKKNIIPKIFLSVYFCKVQNTHNAQYLYTHSVALEGCEPYNDDLKG